MTIPWQVGGGKGYLERFRGDTVAGRRRERLPETLLQGNRARWTAGRCHLERFRWKTVAGGRRRRGTWNTFAGKPWQVEGRESHLEHFRRKTVPGGRQEVLPGTLSREFRGRWEAGKATWNAFAGIPWQVGGGEMPPGTLLRGFRARWAAGKATWNDFAGIPWQVGGGKGYLERFCGDTVAGGRQERLPDTLSRENRGRWAAGKATWNAFAGIPWQVVGKKGYLERFCGETVPGGQRGDATWNAFAGIP